MFARCPAVSVHRHTPMAAAPADTDSPLSPPGCPSACTAVRTKQLTLCRSRQHTPVTVQPSLPPGSLARYETVKIWWKAGCVGWRIWLAVHRRNPEPRTLPFSTSALGFWQAGRGKMAEAGQSDAGRDAELSITKIGRGHSVADQKCQNQSAINQQKIK